MIYGFDTIDEDEAIAALAVYVVYRSRDTTAYKISLSMWEQIERFVKSAAKRAKTIGEMVEKLKPRICCRGIDSRFLYIEGKSISSIFDGADQRDVLKVAYKRTFMIIALVRERLEREKAEKKGAIEI